MRKTLIIFSFLALFQVLVGAGMAILGGIVLFNASSKAAYLDHIEKSLEYDLRKGKLSFHERLPSEKACAPYLPARTIASLEEK